MKYYLLVVGTIATAAAIAFEVYMLSEVIDIIRVIAAG